MENKEKGASLRACALPLLTIFLLLLNLLSGCALPEAPEEPGDSLNLAGIKKSGSTKTAEADLLCLVNPWNDIAPDYVPQLDYLSDGTAVDHRCIEALRALLTACREAGNAPYICSAYRSYDTQSQLFENKIARVMAEGYGRTEAEDIAAREVARPGTSEHQLGLAVDIIDSGYTALDEGQASTPTQVWLMENSWRYGFILRYPADKSDITGFIYEPWHYRYVGEAAAEIYESGLCFEEWLEER